ncbi:ribonuclease H-like domain-containing protein [Entophlyctis helioformis]|nr:ribonuclease H-like domain-containing protein [Entophlyctis helioformis]
MDNAELEQQPAREQLLASLARLSKASQFLNPSELAFIKSSSRDVAQAVDAVHDALFASLSLLKPYASYSSAAAAAASSSSASSSSSAAAALSAKGRQALHALRPDDVTDHFDVLTDIVDNLLEKADILMDSFAKPSKAGIRGSINAPAASSKSSGSSAAQLPSSHMSRPQSRFEAKVDNANTPFVPIIKYKPNARVPLDIDQSAAVSGLSSELETHLSTLANSHPLARTPHPYRFEIENIEYPAVLFEQQSETLYGTMDSTPFTWVDTVEQLESLCSLLDVAQEIAVDLEHHDYRSFQGFTCLIQISTRSEDFVVDAIALRGSLHLLNSSFTNPAIIKVFHGAEMDIQWLQRDFGVYVVNLFDTYHASHALELEAHGLAFLLKQYCDVDTDKRYQLADWRVRPIPAEMMHYARTDTHYLLYIFDRMRKELLAKSNSDTGNLMRVTLERSAQTSLKVYQKDIYDTHGQGQTGWRSLLGRTQSSLNEENVAVFKAIHGWRDHTARKEDESLRYVLPNHMLQTISRVMPTDVPAVLSCCSPTPPLVRLYAKEIAALVEHTVVETRQAAALKSNELAKLKAEIEERELKVKARMAAGPVHTRFDSPDADASNDNAAIDSSNAVPTAADVAGPSISSAALKTNGTPAAVSVQTKTARVPATTALLVERATTSSFLGFAKSLADANTPALIDAQRKVEAIRSRLVLQAPAFTEMLTRAVPKAVPKASSAPSNAVGSVTMAASNAPANSQGPAAATDVDMDAKDDSLKRGSDKVSDDEDSGAFDSVVVAKPGSKLSRKKRRKIASAKIEDGFAPFDYGGGQTPDDSGSKNDAEEDLETFADADAPGVKPRGSATKSPASKKPKDMLDAVSWLDVACLLADT